MAATYQIEDEPRPGPMAHTAVRPLWPLFALMFGGAWIAWPWFLWNGRVVGSPTWRRELAWVAGGALGVLAFGLSLDRISGLTEKHLPYALLLLTLLKIGVSYAVFSLQARTFQIYEHYGGVVRNGAIGVLLVFLLDPWLHRNLPFNPWWSFFL